MHGAGCVFGLLSQCSLVCCVFLYVRATLVIGVWLRKVCVCVCALAVSMQHFQRPLLVWTTPLPAPIRLSLLTLSFTLERGSEKKRRSGWGGSGNNRLLSGGAPREREREGARGEKGRENYGGG